MEKVFPKRFWIIPIIFITTSTSLLGQDNSIKSASNTYKDTLSLTNVDSVSLLALKGFNDMLVDTLPSFYKVKFDSSIYFNGAKVKPKADFHQARFKSYASFSSVEFNKKAAFNNAIFYSDCNFVASQFYSKAIFNGSIFKSRSDFRLVNFTKSADFGGAKFDSTADFRQTTFKDEAAFFAITFNGEAVFGGCLFDTAANFMYTNFNRWANFDGTLFASEVSFCNVNFNSGASFGTTKFSSIANFQNAAFNHRVSFNGCILPDTLYFSFVDSEKEIDLTYSVNNTLNQRKCNIDVYGTDIGKLKFDYSKYKILKKSKYHQYDRSQIGNVYEQVLSMQLKKGFIDGYENADKEYRHFKLTYDLPWHSFALGFVTSKISKYWWDYGYKKWLILVWTPLFLMLFTLINARMFKVMNTEVYRIEKIFSIWHSKTQTNTQLAGISPPDRHTLYSSFFYTSLIFFGLKLNIENIEFKNKKYVMYLFFQYVCGLICVAYLINFVIQN